MVSMSLVGGAHQIVRVGSRRDALWERRTSVDGSASSRLGYIMPSWSRTRAGVANSVARRSAFSGKHQFSWDTSLRMRNHSQFN